MLAISGVPSTLQLIGMLFLPETPIFLYKKDKIKEGDAALVPIYKPEFLEMKKAEMAKEVESVKE